MSVKEDIKNFGDDAYNKAQDLAGKANNATDGFFPKNKGFIIGLVVALTALFSMDSGSSGIMPTLFGLAALAVGIFSDKDGIFSGMFGGAKDANAKEPAKENRVVRAPAIEATGPAPDKKVDMNIAGDTSFMIDKDGKKVIADRAPGAGVMLVKVNSDGQIIELAITNPDGKFTLNQDNSIRTASVMPMKMGLELKKDAENKSYIDMEDAKIKDVLNTARNTIENINKSLPKAEGMSFKSTEHSLNEAPQHAVGSAVKTAASVQI